MDCLLSFVLFCGLVVVATSDDATPRKPDYRHTVILIERHTQYGQSMFIRGGIDSAHRKGCTSGVTPSPCSIPIQHIDPGTNKHFDGVKAWSKGDNYLDWNGAENGQGSYNNVVAGGTPSYWSTSNATHPGHNRLNVYGPDYWLVDINMDCSKTENGFFEFKGYLNGVWEIDLNVGSACTGDSAGTPPYSSKNHFARCGYLNVFHFSQGSCVINEF